MIRTRLALWNTLVLALVLTVLGAIVYSTSRSNLYGTIDADLSERVGFLERNWEEIRLRPRPMDRRGEPPEGRPGFGLGRGPGRGRGPGGPGGPGMGLGMPPPMEGPFPGPDRGVSPEHAQRMEFLRYLMRPRVVTPEGEGFMFDSDTPWDRESMARSLAGERVFSVTTVGEEPVRVLSVPLRVGGRIVAVAQSAESLRESDTIMAKQRRTLLMLLPLALLLTLATGIYLTRLALKPVESIARAAERIEATSLHGRLPVRGKDEFAVLATTFNSMLSRLESSFARLAEAYEAQRRFISDASHELKTPLTALKTRVGVARRGTHTPERYREHLAAI
ncbi:MAG TPA: HAMP domain-containing protein, partial [Fimbriimonas sp.]